MGDPVESMVDARREAMRGLADASGTPLLAGDAPRWGLALSGGGIRSATFCLGLLKALADKRMLLRFDLVSTVSGGGYVGAMLGRLFSRCFNAGEAAAVLDAFAAKKPPWFLWWLRSNGRYLIPSGARDTVFAVALYARNTLAIHVELGLVGLLAGALIASVDLGAWALRASLAAGSTIEAILQWVSPQQDPSQFVPVIAFVLPVLLWLAAVFTCAYWGARTVQQRHALTVMSWLVWAAALTIVVGLAFMLIGTEQPAAFLRGLLAEPDSTTHWLDTLNTKTKAEFGVRAAFLAFGIVTASAWVAGLPIAAGTLLVLRLGPLAGEVAADRLVRARNVLTRGLASVVRLIALVLALAALDRLAWALAFELDGLLGAGVLLAVLAVLLRAGAPLAAMLKPGSMGTAALLRMANVLGLVVTFLLLAWWVSLVQRAALGAVFGGKDIGLLAGLSVIVVIALPSLAYVLLTRGNMDFLNVSSLQTFYRSRLVRAYLGAVNPNRYPEAAHRLRPGLEPANELPPEPRGGYEVRQVADVDPGDDISMHDYAGFACGAPVHLMTACINQTEDPRGRFNRDRRGVPLTIAPQGHFRVDQQPWQHVDRDKSLTLGNWVSISGGAFSPGLGQNTRAGVAALATFAGVRLGYWWDGLSTGTARRRWFPKLAALFDETRGRFPGTTQTHAFLSDGGHAENTGAWPLLAQRCELVVLVDCGADPSYRFEDLENLIRRARIDLQTRIRFLVPKAVPVQAPFSRFGTLDDLAAANSTACIAIARIEYPDRAEPAHLMLVKPNIWPQLPPDVANYHAANPAFPQQTTLDQFFDEAQWESYYALGCALGSETLGALDHPGSAGFAAAIEKLFEDDEQAATRAVERRQAAKQRDLRSSVGATLLAWLTRPTAARAAPAGSEDAAKPAGGRLASRLGAQAVNASIGLGAAATIVFSAYQAIDAFRSAGAQKIRDERAALKEIADLWAKVPSVARAGSEPLSTGSPAWRIEVEAPGALAAALARTSDTLCQADEADWFKQSPLAASIFQDAFRACKAMPPGTAPASCDWLVKTAESPVAPSCLYQEKGTVTCEPRYWAYRYAVSESQRCVAPKLAERRLVEAAQKASRQAEAEALVAAAQAALLKRGGGEGAAAAQQVAATASAAAQRAASTASAVAAEAAAPAPVSESVCKAQAPPACCGKTVYVQTYGSADQTDARGLRAALRSLGASVPPIDDVVASARARNRIAPALVPAVSVRYSDAAAFACATSVLGLVQQETTRPGGQLQRLPASYAQRADQLELWLPPAFMARPAASSP